MAARKSGLLSRGGRKSCLLAERYTIEMQVKVLVSGKRFSTFQSFPITLNIKGNLPIKFTRNYARFPNVFEADFARRQSTTNSHKDGKNSNIYQLIWKTPEQRIGFTGTTCEYPSPKTKKYALRARTRPY